MSLEESLGLGALFAARGAMTTPGEVVVVSIDRDSAGQIGQTAELDTWPRSLHGQLVDQIASAGGTVIAFDLIFEDPRDAEGDNAFAGSMERAGRVLLAEGTEERSVSVGNEAAVLVETRRPPTPELRAAALASAPFVLPRVPVRVSQYWTWSFGRTTGDVASLPVVALQTHLLGFYAAWRALLERVAPGLTADWPPSAEQLVAERGLERMMQSARSAFAADAELGPAARGEIDRANLSVATERALRALVDVYTGPASRYLNYYGPPGTVLRLPYDEVLAGRHATLLAGRAVFVGPAEPRESAQQDEFYTVFSRSTGADLSGVEIGATAFANLLGRTEVVALSMLAHLAVVLVFGLCFGALVVQGTTARAALATLLVAGGYSALTYWQFVQDSVWWPVIVPLAGQLPLGFAIAVGRNYRELSVQRDRVRTALGYYVPRAVAQKLAEQSLTLQTSRQLLHGTCLYTDAERYTSIAEALPPEDLRVLMNDYYKTLFSVVERYGGEISDTAGDSMVAVWASVTPDPAARGRAVDAALAALQAVEAFNASRPLWPLPTRIGLESGELLLGNVGAEQHYEYRAIGDIVNTAARLQSLNGLLGTRVLVSATTLTGIATGARDVGTFRLRGKQQPVNVYEPLGASTGPLPATALAAFAVALALFRQGDWGGAAARFESLAREWPHDGPTRYYAALAATYTANPPDAWTGAVFVATK